MPSYEPNTHINRKLFYAIRRGDLKGVRQALEGGASINALRGNGPQPMDSVLTEAFWSSWRKESGVDVIRLLLRAGARMDAPAPSGVVPMIQAIISYRGEEALKVMIEHAGGIDAFASQFSLTHAQHTLSRILSPHLENETVARVFFKLWDNTPERYHPRSSLTGVHWVWCQLMIGKSKVPPHLLEQIEARAPRPTPESLGHRKWVAWMERLNGQYSKSASFILRDALEMTPVHWWTKVPEAKEGESDPPESYALVDKLLKKPRPVVLKALALAVRKLPGGWKHPKAPNPSVLLRASAVSVATLHDVLKIMPPGNHQDTLSGALRDVLASGIDPHHRQARARALLEAGASPTAPGKEGNTALHLVCQWASYNKNYIRDIAGMLIEHGARMDTPRNENNQTPFQVLEEKNPSLAAERLGETMDADIPLANMTSIHRAKMRF